MNYKDIENIIYKLRFEDKYNITSEYITNIKEELLEEELRIEEFTNFQKSQYYFLCMLVASYIKDEHDDKNIKMAIEFLEKDEKENSDYKAILYGYLSNYHTNNSDIEVVEKMYNLASDMITSNCHVDELIEFNLRHIKFLTDRIYEEKYIAYYVDKTHDIIKNSSTDSLSKYYCEISQIHTRLFDNIVGAIYYLSQALDLAIKEKNINLEARIRIFLALSYSYLENQSKSSNYLKPLIEDTRFVNINSVYKITVLNNLVFNYLIQHDLENASKYIYHLENENVEDNIMTKSHLKSIVYICKANYYLISETENTDKVMMYLDKSKKLCSENKYNEVFRNIDVMIDKIEGSLYFKLGKYESAYNIHIRGLKNSIKKRNIKLIMDFYRLLYKDFEMLGDYKSASYTLKKWIKLKEKWFDEQNNKYSEILLKEYDIHKKEDKILELSYIKGNLVDKGNRDGITGLLNRRFLERYIHDNQYKDNKSVSMFMVDIDYFKEYNDHYGHLKGDDALVSISKILIKINEHIEKSAGQGRSKAVRYGGEEFLLLVEDISYEETILLAKYIIDETSKLNIEHKGSKIGSTLTVSIGISRRESNIIDYEYIIDLADKALYEAKASGRNRYKYLKSRLSFD